MTGRARGSRRSAATVVAALEPGRTSWTLPADAVRLGPAGDATEITAAQVRDVAGRLIAAGHWHDGDPDTLVVFDAGYDLTRLAWLLRDLPVEVLGRLRSDRVMYFPAPAREPGTNGRPLRHGAASRLAGKQPWPAPAVTAVTETARNCARCGYPLLMGLRWLVASVPAFQVASG